MSREALKTAAGAKPAASHAAAATATKTTAKNAAPEINRRSWSPELLLPVDAVPNVAPRGSAGHQ
jgi:hypothetical protein